MQAGEVIWLLSGIGIGLVAAMVILFGMLIVDGRRLQSRVPIAATARVEAPPARSVAAVPEPKRRTREARPMLAPMQPVERPEAVSAAQQRDGGDRPTEPVPAVSDETISNLAAEIARVQVVEPTKAVVQPPVEPVAVAVEPAVPSPPSEPAAEPEAPVEASPPSPVAPVAAEPTPAPAPARAAPKVPSLPKVTPARKFAPALPPREPPAGGKS